LDHGVFGGAHPVFWLPSDVRTVDFWSDPRFAPHADSLEQIRLWLEISVRNAGDFRTGDVVDVLASHGIDWRDPEFQRAYDQEARGQRHPLLDSLMLADPAALPTGPARLLWAATEAVDFVREAYPTWVMTEVDDLNSQVFLRMETIRAISHEEFMSRFQESGKRWFASRSEVDLQLVVLETNRVLSGLKALIADDWAMLDLLAVVRSARFAYDDTPDRLQLKDIEAQLAELAAETQLRVQSLATSAEGDRNGLIELWNHLATPVHQWITYSNEMVKKWTELGPISVDEYRVPPPPALGVPAGVQQEIDRVKGY
jgi:hypothetical protein